MTKLYVKFLGKPEIIIDSRKIEISQKKVEALFLYILFNENCTRDEIVSKFWCDYSEHSAKRNLRNTIYKLKNLLEKDIILTKGNTYISINPQIELIKDINLVITENNEEELFKLKNLIFMDGFFIKDCIEFEKWISSIRNIFEKMFMDKFYKGLLNSETINDIKKIEEYSKKIILLDPYNEKSYRTLMSLYANKGVHNKSIEIYNQLKDALAEDLEISPEKETTELYAKILNTKKTMEQNYKKGSNDIFYGQFTELITIEEEYKRNSNGDRWCNIVVNGEIGIGKSRLIEEFLKNKNNKKVVKVIYNVENFKTSYFGIVKIIDSLMEHISLKNRKEIKYLIEKIEKSDNISLFSEDIYFIILVKVLKLIIEEINEKNLVLYLKSINYIDKKSIHILMETLWNKELSKIFIISEYSENCLNEEKIISKLVTLDNTKIIRMTRLSREEVGEFIGLNLENLENDITFADEVYEITQGNLMLLCEVIKNKRQNEPLYMLNNIIKQKINLVLSNLNVKELKLIETISVFKNGVVLRILSELLQENKMLLADEVEKLKRRELIVEEKIDNEIRIYINLKALGKYIYFNISQTKRALFHKSAAYIYEKMYFENKKNVFYLSELSYHFSFTNDIYKKLYYNIKYMQYRLDYCDEFFPTLKKYNDTPSNYYIDKDQIYKELSKIKQLLNSLENMIENEKIYELNLLLNYLEGRSLIRDGRFEEGIKHIEYLIDKAQKSGNEYYTIHGYLEMIYYSIKTDNNDVMGENINHLKSLKYIDDYEVEKGILFRLEGLYNIINKNFEEAENLLYKSIKLFENPKLINSNYFNIAAAHNYLGNIYKMTYKYDKAEKYYNYAIKICLDKNVKKSLDLFYKNYGHLMFLKKDYEKAEKYFRQAFEIYDLFGTYWERSIAESCMALINLYKGNYEKGIEYLGRAEIYIKKGPSNHEIEILENTKKEFEKYR